MTPERIKKIRGRRGFSQAQLAGVLGLTDPEGNGADRVREFETGKRQPSGPIERLLFLLEHGQIPPAWLPEPAYPPTE